MAGRKIKLDETLTAIVSTAASKRREQDDAKALERHRLERAQREATRNEAYNTGTRFQQTFKLVEFRVFLIEKS